MRPFGSHSVCFCAAICATPFLESPEGSLDVVVRPNAAEEGRQYAAWRALQTLLVETLLCLSINNLIFNSLIVV